jgi:hypothetical protein
MIRLFNGLMIVATPLAAALAGLLVPATALGQTPARVGGVPAAPALSPMFAGVEVDGRATDPTLSAQREAARQAAITREALAQSAGATGGQGARTRGAAFPTAKGLDEKLGDWGLKWLNITEGVLAGATQDAFLFIEGRPIGRAYPRILVDVRAEYSAPRTGDDGSPFRSQFYRLEMDCASSMARLTTIATFAGNGLQGDVRFEKSPPPQFSPVAAKSALGMIQSQACPMAQGKPAPGFQHQP